MSEVAFSRKINISDDFDDSSSCKSRQSQKQKSKKRILLVDDEHFNIKAMKIILQCFTSVDPELVCDIVYNGRDAVNMVLKDLNLNQKKKCSYKVILMDCNMPYMDGYQASLKIRELLYKHDVK